MDSVKEVFSPLKQFADENMDLTYTLAAVGTCFVGYKILSSAKSVFKYCLRPSLNLKSRYGDGWAVVTGASDGIGKGFAFELAKRGFKVGLVGRNLEKLDQVGKEIQEMYKVDTKSVVFDFNVHYTDEKIQELAEAVAVFDKVSLLINNVGMASLDDLHVMSDKDIHKQINVNVVGNTVITKILIPKLLENERSGMVFVGSVSYMGPCPKLAVYSASKNYVHQFALSLDKEYKDKIDVHVSITASVKTNMNSGRYLFTILPDQHAKAVLDKLGIYTVSHGHYMHALGNYFQSKYIEGSIISYINRQRQNAFIEERNKQRKEQKNE